MTVDLECGEFFDQHGRRYDRWIVSYTASRERTYICHLAYPRFVAKVARDPRCTDIGGLSIHETDTTFFDIMFFDEAPADVSAMRKLFRAAATALGTFSPLVSGRSRPQHPDE